MRKLNKPTDYAGDVFIDCIETVRNPNLKARLIATKNLVIDAATEFEEKVTTGKMYTVVRESLINGNVTAKELETLYDRMVRKGTLGRKIYDKLIIASSLGICPLCSHREVTQIDHYLPKSKYPRLSVVPINLIPSCSDCNKSKLNNYPQKADEETLHPYFDDVEDDRWLNANIIHTIPPTIEFEVISPENWSQLLHERVKYHFSSLSLNKLYSIQAAVELVQINHSLKNIYATAGMLGVKNYLVQGRESRSHANINSWQTAMYNAMAEDSWFCNGGFNIPR